MLQKCSLPQAFTPDGLWTSVLSLPEQIYTDWGQVIHGIEKMWKRLAYENVFCGMLVFCAYICYSNLTASIVGGLFRKLRINNYQFMGLVFVVVIVLFILIPLGF